MVSQLQGNLASFNLKDTMRYSKWGRSPFLHHIAAFVPLLCNTGKLVGDFGTYVTTSIHIIQQERI